MPALPAPHLFEMSRDEWAFSPGRTAAVGTAQRASLGRGLAFALLLGASLLGSIYAPMALRGADWVEGTAAPARPASP